MEILTYNPIHEEELLDHLDNPEAGAQVIFKGIVRNHHEGRKVLYLFYEAYEEMVQSEMKKLVEKGCNQFDIYDMVLAHRLGRLEIGQVSLFCAVSSAHRVEAFKACQFTIDELKKNIPIWKKEIYEGGEEWLANPESRSTTP
ncbi:MAG: molybdenum cofactor biosynthesis protein MoaE [Planctomycetota bacterium]